jgi:hypothetical protein
VLYPLSYEGGRPKGSDSRDWPGRLNMAGVSLAGDVANHAMPGPRMVIGPLSRSSAERRPIDNLAALLGRNPDWKDPGLDVVGLRFPSRSHRSGRSSAAAATPERQHLPVSPLSGHGSGPPRCSRR